MRIFTEVEEGILKYLAHYKYMTLGQLIKLDVGGKTYTSTRLKKLREAGFVGVSQYGGVYKSGGGGRAENINYLLPKGAKFLAENNNDFNIDKIHYPKNIDGIFRNDYFHRISTVNTQISFELWAKRLGYDVLFFDTYFHKLGSAKTAKDDNPLRSITRITFADNSFIEPDAIFAANAENKKYFFCLEVHNGNDVTRLIDALKRISRAIAQGLITNLYKEKLGAEKSPRILCTLENEKMLHLVQKRMCNDTFFEPAWMKQAFLLNVAQNVWDDFDNGWQNMVQTIINISSL